MIKTKCLHRKEILKNLSHAYKFWEAILYVKIMPQINLLSLFKMFHFVITDVCGVSHEHCKHTYSLVKCSLQPTLKSRAERIFRSIFASLGCLVCKWI